MELQQEQEFDTRLPYRSGWPNLLSLPLCSRDAREPRGLSEAYDAIIQILKQLQIDVNFSSVVDRYHKETPDKKVVTLLLESNIERGPGIQTWHEAVRLIVSELQRRAINLAVEIIDLKVERGLVATALPILSTDTEALQLWDQAIVDIVELLRDHEWLTLDLVHQKQRAGTNESDLTIIIGARDADESRWWLRTLPAIRRKISALFNIELLYLHDIYSYDTDCTEKIGVYGEDFEFAYDELNIGFSCGPAALNGGGTLGGTMKLAGANADFAITNHHVVCCGPVFDKGNPGNGSVAPGDDLALEGSLVVASPTNYDHDRIQEHIRKSIDYYESRPMNPEHSPRDKSHQAELDRLKQVQEEGEQSDRNIGTVDASSGLRNIVNKRVNSETTSRFWPGKAVRWLSDWALIKLFPDKTMENEIPYPYPHMKLQYGMVATKYQSITPGKAYNVAKYGRDSAWTIGTINAASSVHNTDLRRHSGVEIDSRSGERTLQHTITLAHSIISRGVKERRFPATRSKLEYEPFFKSGDSGSLVLLDQGYSPGQEDEEAAVVGLLFGRNTSSNISYMMPMDVVIDDIEDVTGKKVELPRFDGEADVYAIEHEDIESEVSSSEESDFDL